MKIICGLFLSILLVACASTSVPKNDEIRVSKTDNVRAELEAAYAKFDKAYRDKDVDALSTFYAADFKFIDKGKTIYRAGFIDALRKNSASPASIESNKTTIDKIEQIEGGQIVDCTESTIAKVSDKDGKEKNLTYIGKRHDTWVKDGDGKWLLTSETIEDESYLNSDH